VNGEKMLPVPDILGVDGVEIAFAKREVMDGIQQIGFSGTVITSKAIDLGRETGPCFPVILKIGNIEVLQVH
jgi:hypothetical protein